MGVISRMQLKSVEARRYQDTAARPGQIRIDNTLSVTSLEPQEDQTARVEFNYTASYGAFGVIKIDGQFQFQDEKAQDAVDMWREKRQMPGPVASQIHTSIMQACVPEAVMLAKSIQLPPPIPIPQIQFQKQGDAKAKAEMDPGVA
jgi:hypothetical protein